MSKPSWTAIWLVISATVAIFAYAALFERRSDLLSECERTNVVREQLHGFLRDAQAAREREARLARERGDAGAAISNQRAADDYNVRADRLQRGEFVNQATALVDCAKAHEPPFPFSRVAEGHR